MTASMERSHDFTDLTGLRHALHQVPEVGLDLPLTQAIVLDALSGLDLEITTGINCSSVVGVLRGDRNVPDANRRTILLRADMDGLPLREEADISFRSRHDGAMHACGHDVHTAMLIGVAHVLAAQRDRLPGDVILMFQPGEEGFDGASVMIEEGVLSAAGRHPDAAWALHVMSGLVPRGAVTARRGPMLASSNALRVTVRGAGGHGSAPHRARDPIPAAAEMVTALQTLVSRTTSAFDPVVVTVGEFHAGTKENVIPSHARFSATIRCFDGDVLNRLETDCTRLCHGIATAHGLQADVQFERMYPVTVNDPHAVGLAEQQVDRVLGGERWHAMPNPVAGAEDFSRVLQAVPGAMLFLGASVTDEWNDAPDNHSPHVLFDDAVMSDGVALLGELARVSLFRSHASDKVLG
ncbi:M20 family metallopeptidase [Nonomuraea sp. NPDC049028]|uniref:M20 metallopeptidase family protein n=1 Tax=Nonomuraea sp. NPDC049028 TaxID=3364348 RepID=UPI003723AC7E